MRSPMKKPTLALFLFIIVGMQHSYTKDSNTKTPLHLRTYLTPSIPKALYDLIIDYVNKTTNLDISLSIELVHSGPPQNLQDPFSTKEIDVGHLCSPPFIWLTSLTPCPVELFPLAPIFKDERTNHKPIYFSDVIVASNSSIQKFEDLRGKTWCYNDPESLSGYFCMLQKLVEMKESTAFFKNIHESGGHLASIQLVANGGCDGSAIDSNGLALQFKEHPELKTKIRVIESWGPFPIQPLVISKNISDETKKILAGALQQMAYDKKEALAEFLVEGFGQISDQDFDGERKLLYKCKELIKEKK